MFYFWIWVMEFVDCVIYVILNMLIIRSPLISVSWTVFQKMCSYVFLYFFTHSHDFWSRIEVMILVTAKLEVKPKKVILRRFYCCNFKIEWKNGIWSKNRFLANIFCSLEAFRFNFYCPLSKFYDYDFDTIFFKTFMAIKNFTIFIIHCCLILTINCLN